jgi:hypothetical protein
MPAPVQEQPKGPPPWWPPSLHGAVRSAEKLRAEWQDVVVEEVVGATVELMRWPWPTADRYGRLLWDDDADDRMLAAAVPLRLMRLQLYRPNGLQRRPRPGDTFGARLTAVAGWGRNAPVEDVAALLPGAVYDVSAAAREAAKLAYQGSSAAVFDGGEVTDLLEAARATRESRPRGRRLRVTPIDEVIDEPEELS